MKFFKKYTTWIAAFIFVCAVIFVYKTFDNITQIMSGIGSVLRVVLLAFKPFFIAFVIAYLLNMPARKIDSFLSKRKNKFVSKYSYGIAVASSYAIAVIIIAVIISAILPIFYKNLMDFISNLPNYIASVQRFMNESEIFEKLDMFSIDKIDIFSKLNQAVSKFDASQVGKYAQGVMNFTSNIFNSFIAIVASIYMLIDKERLKDGAKRIVDIICSLVSKRRSRSKGERSVSSDKIISHLATVNEIFINYIYSRLICGIITGILCAVILSVFKIRYAVLLGIIIAVLDLIPYFGSIISSIFSIALTLLTGGLWKTVWAGATVLIVQQFDGNILAPKIMGDSLKIRPLLIIFAVTVGGSLFGFWGMLISVPIVAAIKAVFMEYKDSIKKSFKENKTDNSGDANE